MICTLTHKGWYGIVPVHCGAEEGGIAIVPRWVILSPVFLVSIFVIESIAWVVTHVKGETGAGFGLMVTGRLGEPVPVEFE